MALELTNRNSGLDRLEQLKRLQSIDTRLRDLQRKKRALLADLEEKQAQIQEKKTRLAERQKQTKSFQREIDRKELDLKCLEEEIKKLRLDLFKIRHNKEYNALLSEIGGREANKSVLEDEALAMMTRLEAVAEEDKALAREIQEEEKKLATLEASLKSELQVVERDIEEARREWTEASGQVDREALDQYRRLIEKDGMAVVGVLGEACQGCYMSITPQTLNLLLRGQELILCSNCGRILYLSD